MKSNYKYYQNTFYPRIIKKASKGLTISFNNGIYFNPSFKAYEDIYSNKTFFPPKYKPYEEVKKFDAKQLTQEFFSKLEAELLLKNITTLNNPQDNTEDVVIDLNIDPLNYSENEEKILDLNIDPLSYSENEEEVLDLNIDPYNEAELAGSDSIIDLNSDSEN
jgi:hypothetical protein